MRRIALIGFGFFAVILIVGLIVGKGHPHHTVTTTVAQATSTVAAPTSTPATATGPPHSLIAPGATAPTKLKSPPKNPKDARGVDPQDTNPSLNQPELAQQDQQPAFQYLPLQTKIIRADVSNVAANGQLIVEVEYTKTQAQAEHAWSAFLASHNDPGTAYQVYYIPVHHL